MTSLPEGITSIDNMAFWGCTNLALTSLPAGLKTIEYHAFYNCTSLALTSLPEGLTFIANQTFAGCTNIAISSLPEVITIDFGAFRGCTSITEITLSESFAFIGSSAFQDCTNLSLVTCYAETPPGAVLREGEPPEMAMPPSNMFENTHPDLQIKVPAGSVQAYQEAEGWSDYADIISAID